MPKYTLLILPENNYIYDKIINSSDDSALVYKNDRVVAILDGKDSGLDLFIKENITIKPGETKLVGTGVRCKMINNDNKQVDVGYYMYPRSSIYKTPLRLANSVGIIDMNYRGEIKIPLTNYPNVDHFIKDAINPDINQTEKYTYEIKKGVRLVQICSPDLSPFSVRFVDNLDDTGRGNGGFGSTGI